MVLLSPDLKCTGSFLFLSIRSHPPGKMSNTPEITMLGGGPSYPHGEVREGRREREERERERNTQPAPAIPFIPNTRELRFFLDGPTPRYPMNRRTIQLNSAHTAEL